MKKKYVDIICFIILNLLVLLIFLPWLQGHYATDDYKIINIGYEHYSINNSLVDGRIYMFIIMQLADIININFDLLSAILLGLSLIISNIAVMIIKKTVFDNLSNKNIKNLILSYIISYTLIYNFMYIENLYFIECFVMAMAVLLNIIAARIFSQKKSLYILKTISLVLISIFCYQGTISSFLAFVILFEILKKQSLSEFIKNIFIAALIIGIACVSNLIFVKVVSNVIGIPQSRLSNNILYNIKYILKRKIFILIGTSNNFYNGLFLLYLTMLITCFKLTIRYKDNKDEYIKFFMFLILGIIFCTDIPYIVSLSSFEVGRTRFAIGALCSITVIYFLNKHELVIEKYKRFLYSFVYCFIIVYFVLNIVNYIEIIYNAKVNNKCEKEYVEGINNYIIEYEKNNNTIIEKIQLVYDNNANNTFFSECTRKNVMTGNACTCTWSAVGVINYYSNRNLIEQYNQNIEMEEMYKIEDDILYVKIGIK